MNVVVFIELPYTHLTQILRRYHMMPSQPYSAFHQLAARACQIVNRAFRAYPYMVTIKNLSEMCMVVHRTNLFIWE